MVPADGGPASPVGRQVLVIFEDRNAPGCLRLLRPGFRHCYCMLWQPAGWLLCDPLKGSLELSTLPSYGADEVVRGALALGRHVAEGITAAPPAFRFGMLRPLTCVEVVKRAIGVVDSHVVTPFQLYRRLSTDADWRAHVPADELGAEVLDCG